MNVRVLTLCYDPTLRGFPEGAIQQALAGGEVTDVREHFFVHGGVPHLCLVLVMDDGGNGRPRSPQKNVLPEEDFEANMPENARPLYRVLRRWRNETANRYPRSTNSAIGAGLDGKRRAMNARPTGQ